VLLAGPRLLWYDHTGCSRGSSLYEFVQQPGYEPIERVDCVGEMRLLSRATIQGRGENRYGADLVGAEGSVEKMKSISYECGHNLRIIHDK
jgi:hypothetical protein